MKWNTSETCEYCGEAKPGGPPTHNLCMCVVCPICDELLGDILDKNLEETSHQHMRTHYKFAGTDIDKENNDVSRHINKEIPWTRSFIEAREAQAKVKENTNGDT